MDRTGRGRVLLASPVVETEGEVGGLLDLGYDYAAVSRMHGARLHHYGVSLRRLYHIEYLLDRTVLAAVVEFLGAYLALETGIYPGSRLHIHYIPHLGLAEGVVAGDGCLVVRMHLDGELVIDIQIFDKQRELASVLVEDLLAHNAVQVSLHQIAYAVAGEPAFADQTVTEAHVRYLPALAYPVFRTQMMFVSLLVGLDEVLAQLTYERIASPGAFGCNRNELQGIQLFLFFHNLYFFFFFTDQPKLPMNLPRLK